VEEKKQEKKLFDWLKCDGLTNKADVILVASKKRLGEQMIKSYDPSIYRVNLKTK
jgi:hypothetical protein